MTSVVVIEPFLKASTDDLKQAVEKESNEHEEEGVRTDWHVRVAREKEVPQQE